MYSNYTAMAHQCLAALKTCHQKLARIDIQHSMGVVSLHNGSRSYHKDLFQVEPGLLKGLSVLVQVFGQLVGILNGHAASLAQIGLHCMSAVAQQNDILLGPLEDRRAIIDVTTQHISLRSCPAY